MLLPESSRASTRAPVSQNSDSGCAGMEWCHLVGKLGLLESDLEEVPYHRIQVWGCPFSTIVAAWLGVLEWLCTRVAGSLLLQCNINVL